MLHTQKESEQASLAAFKKPYSQREASKANSRGSRLAECRAALDAELRELNGGWRTPERNAGCRVLADILVRLEAALRGPIQQVA